MNIQTLVTLSKGLNDQSQLSTSPSCTKTELELELINSSQILNQSPSNHSDILLDQNELSEDSLISPSKKIKKIANRRDKYNLISDDVRLALIDAVTNKKQKIKKAADKLGINYSSAKSVLQVYKKEGRANKKSAKKNKPTSPRTIVVHKISPKANFINITFKTSSLPTSSTTEEIAKMSSGFSVFDPFSQVKHKESSFALGNWLIEQDSRTGKQNNSDTFSVCSTNALTSSRLCSAGLEEERDELTLHKEVNSPYFLITLQKSDYLNNLIGSQDSAFSKHENHKTCKDARIPEFREALSLREISYSSLFQNHNDSAPMKHNTANYELPLPVTPKPSNSFQNLNSYLRDNMMLKAQQEHLRLLISLNEQQRLFNTLSSLLLQRNRTQQEQSFASQGYLTIPPFGF